MQIVKPKQEIWKDIPEYEGMYQISNYGRVKSLTRLVYNGYGHFFLKERILKYSKVKGYYQTALSKNGVSKTISAHILTIKIFVGKCPKGKECCHNNDIKTDNRIENLRWDTHKNNLRDAIKNNKTLKGSKNSNSKLKEDDVLFIKKALSLKLFKNKELARMFNVKEQCIRLIKIGENWGWLDANTEKTKTQKT